MNSKKRESCYQCEKALCEKPEEEVSNSKETCASCYRSFPSPPLGKEMAEDHVWCSLREVAVSAAAASSECFEQTDTFVWQRDQILD